MNRVIAVIAFIASVSVFQSGCSFWNKGTHYQVPDYYETGLIVKQPVAGKTYYIKDLRCSKRSAGCHQQESISHRKYEKPYYLSK